MTTKENSTVKTVSLMMAITLIGKILGLIRDQFLAGNYAFGMEASAFLTASRIPRIFFDAIFASAISASFIPVFTEYLQRKGKDEAFKLSSNFITIVGIFTLVITILGITFAPQLTLLFADGFDAKTAELCGELLKIMFLATFFTGIAFSFVGILQSMDEFNIPAAMSIASNLVIIGYYVFFNKQFGIYGLSIAFLLGWGMQALIQVPSLIKKGYKYRPIFNIKDEGIVKIFALMFPVMVSTWIQPINLAINTKFASRLLEGAGVSAIEYANTVYSIIVGIFVLSIVNVIFPKLARLITNNDEVEFNRTVSATTETMMFFLIPMTAGLMCVSIPMISVIYERGVFGNYETQITANALFYLSIGMLGFGVQNILSRAFYAKQNGKIPLISGVFSIATNIILCIILSPKMGVSGLALASALSSIVSAVILIVPMQMKNKVFSLAFLKEILKMAIAALLMSTFVLIVLQRLDSFSVGIVGNLITLTVSVTTGGALYFLASKILKINQCNLVFVVINDFLKRKVEK